MFGFNGTTVNNVIMYMSEKKKTLPPSESFTPMIRSVPRTADERERVVCTPQPTSVAEASAVR
jgi:hypothetical protein